ncbi:hypothetical protein PybrP1_000937 [[Pythium] brassicae (nom. inval.)]|nr:hypothetical protein PybrP1_000937 [[Pythium] brassicae (nom. inval.)]
MSSDEDERVKLYNPLERNRKRQHFVSFSSSESDSDSALDFAAADSDESPLVRKTRRRSLRQSVVARTVELDNDDDDVDVETLMTEAERAASRQSVLQIEREIAQRIAQDALLSQTRAIMSSAADGQRSASGAVYANGIGSSQRQPQPQPHSDKGERIVLKIRSNGSRTDDVPIHMKEPFDVLYKNFCDQLGLPRSAVAMNLDGDALALTATPASSDLATGDLIDAKVDFSRQRDADIKKFVRLRLVVEGRRPEVFKIDTTSTIEKLRASFCKKHTIEFPEDVTLSALGAKLRVGDTIESYALRDDDDITVEIASFVDPLAIAVQLRFSDGTIETHHIIPSAKVESLQTSIAHSRQTSAQLYYDLEGGELIEVKLSAS